MFGIADSFRCSELVLLSVAIWFANICGSVWACMLYEHGLACQGVGEAVGALGFPGVARFSDCEIFPGDVIPVQNPAPLYGLGEESALAMH